MIRFFDFKKYFRSKLIAWNKELIEEVSKELDRYTEIFSPLFLQKIKNDLYEELVGPFSEGRLLSPPWSKKLTSNFYGYDNSKLDLKSPHLKDNFAYQDSIELIAVMQLINNLKLIQTFLENKEKQILQME